MPMKETDIIRIQKKKNETKIPQRTKLFAFPDGLAELICSMHAQIFQWTDGQRRKVHGKWIDKRVFGKAHGKNEAQTKTNTNKKRGKINAVTSTIETH